MASQFAIRMNRNNAIAIGTTNGAVRTPMVDSTCSSIWVVTVSRNNCGPVGLVVLRCARTYRPRPMTMAPAIRVPRMVSTFQARPKTFHTMWPPTSMSSATGWLLIPGYALVQSVSSESRSSYRSRPQAAEHRHRRAHQHQHLEDRQPDEDTQTVGTQQQGAGERDDGDQPQPGEHLAGELQPPDRLVLAVLEHRTLQHPVVEGAQCQADAAEHAREGMPV